MSVTEIASLESRKAPLASIRRALKRNSFVALDTSVYLFGMGDILTICEERERKERMYLGTVYQHLYPNVKIWGSMLRGLLEETIYEEGLVFPEQVFKELRLKLRVIENSLMLINGREESDPNAIRLKIDGLMTSLVPAYRQNLNSLNDILDISSSRFDQIAYSNEIPDSDPDVGIISSTLSFAGNLDSNGSLAFVTQDRGFKDKIPNTTRVLRRKGKIPRNIFVYEVSGNLREYKILKISSDN